MQASGLSGKKRLLLIAFDGFRFDYAELQHLLNFKRFIDEGARSRAVKPVFPSLTYANFYSMATGKYPENSGLVGNNFTDPETKTSYLLFDNDSHDDLRWYTMNDTEPFWITAKKHGLKVGSYMWPSTHVPFIDKNGASIALDYAVRWVEDDENSPSINQRIDHCFNLMLSNDYDLTLCYIDEPDHTAHVYGPDSEQMVEKLKLLDAAVAHTMAKVDELKLTDQLDVVIVSDHGAALCPPEKRLLLQDIVGDLYDESKLQVMEKGAVLTLVSKDGESIDEELLERLRRHGHLNVYRRNDVPERFHWKANRRSADVLVVCDEQYRLCIDEEDLLKGDHGYDNDLINMRGILFCRGPSFKRGYVTNEDTEMIDTYRLICALLQLEPKQNDSSSDAVFGLLG